MATLRCVTLPEKFDELYDILYRRADPERRQRARRYLRREDGLRCLAAGELLRQTVERTLGITEFSVVKDPGGKPRIDGLADFHFNLSHSGRRSDSRTPGGYRTSGTCGSADYRRGRPKRSCWDARQTALRSSRRSFRRWPAQCR